MTVSLIGLSAVLVGRFNLRAHERLNDATAARLHAHSALELGMKQLHDDPNWRQLGTDWLVDQQMGSGTFSLSVSDPIDGDLTDDDNDPVVLTGTGTVGHSIYQAEITVMPSTGAVSCLESAIHAGDDIQSSNNVPYCDHIASANDDIKSFGAQYQMDVEAHDRVTGTGYLGSTATAVAQRNIPDSLDVVAFYIANGTAINVNSLPTSFVQFIRNGSFENGIDNWESESSQIYTNTLLPLDGASSLVVDSRQSAISGASQDITRLVTAGRQYRLRFGLRAWKDSETVYAHVVVTDRAGFQHTATLGPLNARSFWKQFDGLLTIPNADTASVRLLINTSPDLTTTAGSTETLQIDAVTLEDPATVYNLNRVLLSPASNPFGTTNPDGIYVLNMKGNQLSIRNSRIHGTLVLLNPDITSEIGDGTPLLMTAANPDYPTLIIAGGQARIFPSKFDLDEQTLQTNFNPIDAPYPGISSNTTQTDSYPSGVHGLIYSRQFLAIRDLRATGTIVGGKDIDIQGSFSLKWDNRFYLNPPPGFVGSQRFRVLSNSAKRVVD